MIKFLFAVLLIFTLVAPGESQCSLKNLSLHQKKAHGRVKNKPVWNVTITNNCYCSQMNVRIACEGFRSVKSVDSSVVKMSSGRGLVNRGQPIYPYSSVAFTYAWNQPFRCKLLSSQVACS